VFFLRSLHADVLAILGDGEDRGPAQCPSRARRQAAKDRDLAPGRERLLVSERDFDRIARREIRDCEIRDRVQNRLFLLPDRLGGDSIELVVRRVRGGRGIERDAEVERETGQDRLAGGRDAGRGRTAGTRAATASGSFRIIGS
jgi:hypothetical protein